MLPRTIDGASENLSIRSRAASLKCLVWDLTLSSRSTVNPGLRDDPVAIAPGSDTSALGSDTAHPDKSNFREAPWARTSYALSESKEEEEDTYDYAYVTCPYLGEEPAGGARVLSR